MGKGEVGLVSRTIPEARKAKKISWRSVKKERRVGPKGDIFLTKKTNGRVKIRDISPAKRKGCLLSPTTVLSEIEQVTLKNYTPMTSTGESKKKEKQGHALNKVDLEQRSINLRRREPHVWETGEKMVWTWT